MLTKEESNAEEINCAHGRPKYYWNRVKCGPDGPKLEPKWLPKSWLAECLELFFSTSAIHKWPR